MEIKFLNNDLINDDNEGFLIGMDYYNDISIFNKLICNKLVLDKELFENTDKKLIGNCFIFGMKFKKILNKEILSILLNKLNYKKQNFIIIDDENKTQLFNIKHNSLSEYKPIIKNIEIFTFHIDFNKKLFFNNLNEWKDSIKYEIDNSYLEINNKLILEENKNINKKDTNNVKFYYSPNFNIDKKSFLAILNFKIIVYINSHYNYKNLKNLIHDDIIKSLNIKLEDNKINLFSRNIYKENDLYLCDYKNNYDNDYLYKEVYFELIKEENNNKEEEDLNIKNNKIDKEMNINNKEENKKEKEIEHPTTDKLLNKNNNNMVYFITGLLIIILIFKYFN